MPSPALVARGVAKTLTSGDTRFNVLEDIELTLNRGASLAIVGTSGSGKSTLLALLAGLDRPTRGTIELLGADLTDMDENARAAWRAARVGFVFQSFQLLGGLSAVANVMLPLELAGAPLAHARDTACDLLVAVGLGHRLQHTPRRLSGGEQQRVAVARAFACDPAILFADEPTGNLDSATGARVIDLLFELNERATTTLVLVTHDQALAKRCDSRARLVDGRLRD